MKILRMITFLLFSTSFASSAFATTSIDTTIGWNGEESVAPFGDVDAGESYGQTFVVTAQQSSLTSFSFWLERSPLDTSNLPIDFAAFVMAWDGSKPTGPILFESTQQAVNTIGMQEFTFNTGGLALLPGQTYIAFLNASNYWDGITSEARVGFRFDNLYPDGEFWSQNTGQYFTDVSAYPWQNTFPGSDLVFRAVFSAAEPSIIDIDIKPDADVNTINPRSNGLIPVAIITTGEFDALQVDPDTVLFGNSQTAKAHSQAHVEDVDHDGDMDLLFHFGTKDAGFQCGDTEATLTGKTWEGTLVSGSDSVDLVRCK